VTAYAPPGIRRTDDQRAEALKLANRVRVERSKLKRRLRTGEVQAWEVFADPPTDCLSMKAYDVLRALPKMGDYKAARMLAALRISPAKTVGGLSQRQRDLLVGLLRAPTALDAYREATR